MGRYILAILFTFTVVFAFGQRVSLSRMQRAAGMDFVILTDSDGKQTYVHKDSMGLDATTDDQNLTVGGSGPTYTIDIETGSDVTIAAGGINALSEGTPNILTITATEVDGSTTNEIQQIDTFTIVSNVLRASLSSDAVPFKSVDLSPYLDNTDAQGLTITGSGPTYVVDISGGSDVTIEAAGITTLSEGTANVLTITSTEVDGSVTNEIQNVDTLVLTGTTLGISLSSDGIPQKTVDLSSLQDGIGLTGSGTSGRIAYWNADTLTSTIWEITSTYIRGSGTGWPEIKDKQYGFRGDDDTGYRWSEANVLGLHAGDDTNPMIEIFGDPINNIVIDADNNGTSEWILSASGQSNTAATGNAKIIYSGSAAPQFTSNGDEDTGLRRSAADVVGLHAGDATNPLIKADGPGVAVTFDPDDDGTPEVTINATTTSTELLDIGTYGTTATKLAGLNSSGVVTEMTVSTGLSLAADVLTATDASITNELQTLAHTSNATSHTTTLSNSGGSQQLVEGTGISLTTTGTGLDGIVTIANTGIITEVDGSTTNEIQQIDTFTIVSNTLRASLSSDGVPFKSVDLSPYLDNTDAQALTIGGSGPTYTVDISGGADVTIAAAGITTLSEGTANVLTFTTTEVDGSVTNELQDLTIGGSGPTYTVDIANGSDVTIEASGITTLSEPSANVLRLTTTEVDGSVTNEIQTIDVLSLSGTVLHASLSSDGAADVTVELESLQDVQRLFVGDDNIGSDQVISVGGGAPYDTIAWTTTFQQEQGITYGAPNASADSSIIFARAGVYEVHYTFEGELAAAATNVTVSAKWNKNSTTAVPGSSMQWGFESTEKEHYGGVFQVEVAANDFIQLLMKNSTASASNLSFGVPKIAVKYIGSN